MTTKLCAVERARVMEAALPQSLRYQCRPVINFAYALAMEHDALVEQVKQHHEAVMIEFRNLPKRFQKKGKKK